MTAWTDLVKKIYGDNKHKKGYKLGHAMKAGKKIYKTMKAAAKRNGKTAKKRGGGEHGHEVTKEPMKVGGEGPEVTKEPMKVGGESPEVTKEPMKVGGESPEVTKEPMKVGGKKKSNKRR